MKTETKETLEQKIAQIRATHYTGTILHFDGSNTSIKEAKREASTLFNRKSMIATVNKFIYLYNENYHVFTRINNLYPTGDVKFGVWK